MSEENFMKFDGKKNRLELIEPDFILGIGQILTYGAEKYEAYNWRKADSQEDLERIKGATMRHMMAYMKGEKNDVDTKLSHLYHMGCNLMFLDYFDRNGLQAEPDVVEVSTVAGINKVDDSPYARSVKRIRQLKRNGMSTSSTAMRRHKEVDAIGRWLEGSDHYAYNLIREDWVVEIYDMLGDTVLKFTDYDAFFEWFIRDNPELYIKNGGSKAFVEGMKNKGFPDTNPDTYYDGLELAELIADAVEN